MRKDKKASFLRENDPEFMSIMQPLLLAGLAAQQAAVQGIIGVIDQQIEQLEAQREGLPPSVPHSPRR